MKLSKPAKITLIVVLVIIIAIVVAYAAGVRVWISNNAAADQSANLPAAAIGGRPGPRAPSTGVSVPVTGSWSIGLGTKSLNICLGCRPSSFFSSGGYTDYSSQSDILKKQNDRDSGDPSYND